MLGIALLLLMYDPLVTGHGQITWPPARTNGSLEEGGSCEQGECYWFTQPTVIPGKPTINDAKQRTFNVHVSGGPGDWSSDMPWRAPGSAPVYGSGCGVAGGSPFTNMSGNGGVPPPGIPQGFDGLHLPARPPTRWQRGTSVEVAYAMLANHGGGVSWRLCPADGSVPVTEECFQRNTLRYTGNSQWIRYRQFWQWDKPLDVPDFEIPLVRVTEGTTPPNSEWARNPIPSCLMCDQRECMSSNLTWIEQQYCAQACSGFNVTNCPPGMVQFPEPGPGLSGFYRLARCSATSPNGLSGFPYSVVSRVDVPTDLSPGPYLLSWRWDCEQSRQIWQNCADIILT